MLLLSAIRDSTDECDSFRFYHSAENVVCFRVGRLWARFLEDVQDVIDHDRGFFRPLDDPVIPGLPERRATAAVCRWIKLHGSK